MLSWLLKPGKLPKCKVCGDPQTVDAELCGNCWREAAKTDFSLGEDCSRCGERMPPSGFKHRDICWGCWND